MQILIKLISKHLLSHSKYVTSANGLFSAYNIPLLSFFKMIFKE